MDSPELTLHRLCATTDLGDGEMLRRDVDALGALAVVRVGDEFFVVDDTCTHSSEASLSVDGEVDGYEIECSWHLGRFDVRTGAVTSLPCQVPLRVHETAVEDGGVFVKVPPAGPGVGRPSRLPLRAAGGEESDAIGVGGQVADVLTCTRVASTENGEA